MRHVTLLLLGLFSFVSLTPNFTLAAPGSDRAIAQAQNKIRRNPNNPMPYFELGDAYIQKARESGDISYFDRAEEALRKSLNLNPQQSAVLRHLAFVLSSRHDFDAAAVEAEKAIALNPNDFDAHGVLGDAYEETGKYSEAEKSYAAMIGLKESLSSRSRLSGLKSLKGDTKGAIADLQKAIQLGSEQNQPNESIAWAQWQLGMEQFAVGRIQDAEKAYLAALATYPNYYRANAGLAQVRAAQKRFNEAMVLYQKALEVVPYPEYAAALGDLYQRLDRVVEAKKQYDLVEYIGYLSSLNQVIYNRELANFYSDHDAKLPEALALAQKEFEVRKDIYGYDALAWSLFKNNRSEEAKGAIEEALKLGTKDAKLYFHAGMIYRNLGDKEKAREFLQRALAINPYFHVIHADIARRALAQLNTDRFTETTAISKRQ
jgi:tetratricopeptide (TPR) repeat protein